jgi:hypothetical protein
MKPWVVLEVLKGSYDPENYPEDPKGYFTFGVPSRQLNMDHQEEIWLLGKSQILLAPADAQPDPKTIGFHPAKVYDDRLELPLRNGFVAFPTVGQRYRNKVLDTRTYKAAEFLAQIRAAVRIQNSSPRQ